MAVLIVAATEFEIRPTLGHMAFLGKENESLLHYRFRSMSVDVLIPGIGMMQTAFHLGKILDPSTYSFAFNAGIAGTYHDRLNIGSVVNVVEECMPEMCAEDGEKIISMFELGLMDPDAFPYRSGKLHNFRIPPFSCLENLARVKGNTVSKVNGISENIKKTTRFFPADVESMEGAAFLYGCLTEGMPCVQIRSISNRVEERDKSRWNIPLALKNLNKVMLDLLREVEKG